LTYTEKLRTTMVKRCCQDWFTVFQTPGLTVTTKIEPMTKSFKNVENFTIFGCKDSVRLIRQH